MMHDKSLPPLVVIIGPTAVGKTGLAVWLSRRLAVEVVSADSRQLYRDMDIGTAKATTEEQGAVEHHLIDILAPDQPFTLAEYQALAYEAIDAIHGRGHLPLLLGGTGQYVRAVVEGWRIPQVPPDEVLRTKLYARAEAFGSEALHNELSAVDEEAAAKIDHRNVRRVVRALEVYHTTGRPISELQRKRPPPYDIMIIGLTLPRPQLYQRVDRRVDGMIAAGLVDEVRALLAQGYDPDLPAMSGLGYREIIEYLCDQISLEDAIQAIKSNTRKFIRHQYNWFKPNDPRIQWFDLDRDGRDAVYEAIQRFLADR